MANSIASAVRYINNDAELNKIFATVSHVAEFLKPNVAIGARTVKYRKVTLGESELGTFNRATGYTSMDVNSTWVERTLTQDKGNSLGLDKMDGEEAQGLEIATVHNKFMKEKVIPYVDRYSLNAWATATGVHTVTVGSTESNITADTVIDEIKKALKYLFDMGVNDGVVAIVSSSTATLIDSSNAKRTTITEGSWNGEVGKQATLINGLIKAKLKVVPDGLMPTKVDFMVAPVDALAFIPKYQENVFFDKIPGFGGRRSQVDSGIYFDSWAEPGAEKAVYVHKAK